LARLPRTLVVTAEADEVRDEGELYALKLAQAGVPTTMVHMGGTAHDFVMVETPATRAVVLEVVDLLKSLFTAAR
jgi:acetyl esterase